MSDLLRRLESERDFWETRFDRLAALFEANPMRRDDWSAIAYADGVRFGLDIAILAIHEREAQFVHH